LQIVLILAIISTLGILLLLYWFLLFCVAWWCNG